MDKLSFYMRNSIHWIGITLVAFFFSLQSCGDKKPAVQQAPPPTSVAIYTAGTGNATYFDSYPATVTPLNQVDIRPQVSGNIIAIHFKDGQHVHKGQPLYEIDQQQYRAAVEQAIANLNVAKANLAKSQQDADRYTELSKQDAIAKQTLDHQLADLESSKRQVEAAQANVASVQTNLKYSSIAAPFDGTIGISQVKIGTAVYPQTLLNTISTDNPMAVDIAIDQSEIVKFAQFLKKGAGVIKDTTFTVSLPDNSIYPYPGELYLLDRAVDPQTGTIKARLTFPNLKYELIPGLTANVRVKHDAGDTSLLIPFKAVVEQLGEYMVYVTDTSRAFQRKVLLGTKIGDKVVIRSGLQAGDKVVIEGVQKLRDSSAIKIAPAKPAGAK